MVYGKTIELFLVDGKADGVVTVELSNWNGKAISMPRADVKNSDRKDIKLPGVYFLFCEDKNNDGKKGCYIGEAENIQERMKIHINHYNLGKETFYWTTMVCFVSDKLNKALVLYLEKELVKKAKAVDNCEIYTKRTRNPNLKESDISSMSEFIENIKIIIKTLGYTVIDQKEATPSDQILFYCKGNKADATGYPSAKGFTVQKGAIFSDHTVPSFETNVKSWFVLRKELEANGTVKDRVLQKNYEFSSPSAASAIVLGRPSNGNADWKTSDGTMLKDI